MELGKKIWSDILRSEANERDRRALVVTNTGGNVFHGVLPNSGARISVLKRMMSLEERGTRENSLSRTLNSLQQL